MMNERYTVYRCYKDSNGKIKERTVFKGNPIPKGCCATKEEASNVIDEREKAAFILYESHKEEANVRLDSLETKINTLLDKENASICFSFEGDSHGIYNDNLYLTVTIAGNDYERIVTF